MRDKADQVVIAIGMTALFVLAGFKFMQGLLTGTTSFAFSHWEHDVTWARDPVGFAISMLAYFLMGPFPVIGIGVFFWLQRNSRW